MFLKNIPLVLTRATRTLIAKASNLSPRLKASAAFLIVSLFVGTFWIQPALANNTSQPTPAATSLASIADYIWSFFASNNDGPRHRTAWPISDELDATGARQLPTTPNALACPAAPGVTRTVGNLGGPLDYPTIQDAINASSLLQKDTIDIYPGTYTEQIIVNKCVLIKGHAAGVTIKAPTSLAPSSVPGITSAASVIEVRSQATAEISDLTVAGPITTTGCGQERYGIYVNEGADLTLTNVTVDSMLSGSANGPFFGCQEVSAIRAGSAAGNQVGTLHATGLTVSNFQKTGIIASGPGSAVDLQSSNIAGVGNQPTIAQNGVQVSGGATSSVTGTSFSGLACDNPACSFTNYYSYGIIVYDGSGNFSGNTFTTSDAALYVLSPGGSSTIDGNTINATRYSGIDLDEGTHTVTNNLINGDGTMPVTGIGILSYTGASGNTSATLHGNSIVGTLATQPAPPTPPLPTAGIWINDFETGDSFVPNASISFNRLANNPGAGIRNDSSGSTVTAENNWWGCNAGPGGTGCDTVTGATTYSTWLTLSGISASPTTVALSGASNISGVNLCVNSASANVCTATDHTPDGLAMAYSSAPGTAGSVAPAGGTFTTGNASGTTFTATAGPIVGDQIEEASATFDNETISTNIVVSDGTAPTVSSILRADADPTNAGSVDFTVIFSESVSNVDVADFSLTTTGVSGASVLSVAGSGSVYTVTVNTGSNSGTIRLDVPNTATINDLSGTALTAAFTTGQAYTIDKDGPTGTLAQASGQADPTAASPIHFTVTFSEAVMGFDDTDVTFLDTPDDAFFDVNPTVVVTGGPTTFDIAVSGMNQPGFVRPLVGAGAVTDVLGNSGADVAEGDNSVYYTVGASTLIVDIDGAASDANFPASCSDPAPTAYTTIQSAINAASNGNTIKVCPGTYVQEANVSKTVRVVGAGPEGPNATIVSGPAGGDNATIRISADDVEISGLQITREGNNTIDWNEPTLKSAGIAIQGGVTGALIHDNYLTGNRTAIDINNSSGHTIRNNKIDFNRTGLIFRNTTDNITLVENQITNNWTVGLVFLDGSSGSNSPVQSFNNSIVTNNDLGGNWYGQIVDRQTSGSLPAPGANPKNFQGNWFGTTAPVVTTANSAEPGYSGLIPVAYGGTATPPAGQPDIEGPASANIRFDLPLTVGTDTDVETTPGRGTYGFQGANLVVNSAQTINDADPRPPGWFFWNEGPNGSHGLDVGPSGGLGSGSARLSVDVTGRESFGTAAYGGIRLRDFSKLKFKTWTNGPTAPVLQFDVDNDLTENTILSDTTYQGRLSFQPTAAVVQNGWQQWDVLAPGTLVWGSGSGANRPFSNACTQNSPCLLSDVLADSTWANLGVHVGGTMLFRQGGPNATDITAFVDDFEVGLNTGNTTYDFEPNGGAAPTVTSITRADANPTNATSVTFNVVFSEPVNGVDVNDFVLATTGAVTGESVTNVSGSAANYVVTVATGTGSGTIRLDLPVGATITDVANNAFVGPYTGGEAYTIDKTGPTSVVTAVNDPDSASPVDFTVDFGETVTGFDATDVTIGGTANPSQFTISGTGPYTVHVTGMNTSGTVTVAVNNAGVTDALENVGTGTSNGSAQFNQPSTTVVQTPIGGTWAYYDDVTNAVIPGYDYVFGPAGGPLPAGSARLQSGAGALKGLFTQDYNNTKLANITTLSYSTYVHGSASNEPTLQFNVDYDLDDSDESYQGRVVYVPSQNGTVSADTWQNWNALTGVFWYSTLSPNASECTQSSPCTVAQMLAAHPNMGINSSNLGAIGFRSEPNSNSNVDNFVIGVNSSNTIVNFEPAGTVVVTPTDANWFFWDDTGDTPCDPDYIFGPAGGPLPVGSARLASASCSNSVSSTTRKGLFTYAYRGTPISSITALSYSTYVPTGSNVPTLQIGVDFTGAANPGYQGRLVYIPSGVVNDTWQTWNLDLATARFYYSSGTYSPNGDGCLMNQGSGCTLATILAAHPNARIMPNGDPGTPDPNNTWGVLGFRSENGSTSSVDNLTVGVNGANTVVNFEPAGNVTVNPANMNGWETRSSDSTAITSFRTGPASAPIGNGSVQFNTGTDGDQYTMLYTTAYGGVPLSSITSIGYSTYVHSNVDGQAPYLVLRIDNTGDGNYDDRLYFEPTYQNGVYGPPTQCPSFPSLCVGHDTWQTWDAFAGVWYDETTSTYQTLATYLLGHPTATIVNYPSAGPTASPAGVYFVAGAGAPNWNNFSGNVDAFKIGISGAENTYNFEAAPPTVSIADATPVAEGTDVVFTVSLTGDTPQRTLPVTVVVNTTDGSATAGADYTPVASQLVTFAPNVYSQQVHVTTATDTVAEGNETFTATISDAVNAGLGTYTATGTITDGGGYVAIGGRVTAYSNGAGIPGVTMTLTGTSNGSPVNLTTTTDASGNYNFDTGLSTTGEYSVAPTPVGGYVYDPESIYFIDPPWSVANANFVGYSNDNPRDIVIGTVSQGQVGANVEVPITLNMLGTETGADFDLVFDDTKLQFVSVSSPGSIVGVGPNTGPSSPKRISVESPSGAYPAGTVTVTVTFTTTPGTALNTLVTFGTYKRVTNIQGIGLPADWHDGSVIFAQGNEGDITNGSTGGYTDGNVNILDVGRIRQLNVHSATLNPNVNEFQRADAGPYPSRGDGCINILDVYAIRLYQTHRLPTTQAAGPSSPTCRSAGKKLERPVIQSGAGIPIVNIVGAQATRGSNVDVQVELVAQGNEGGVGFEMLYDSTVFDPNPVATLPAGSPAGVFLDTYDDPAADIIYVGYSLPPFTTIPPGARIIINFNFHVKAGAPLGLTPIAFSGNAAAQIVMDGNGDPINPAEWNDGSVLITLAPTAATSSVAGQVRTADGRGIGNTVVTLTGTDGSVRRALTNQMGYYRIDEVPTGATYVIGATSKRYTFDSRIITVGDNITDADMIPRE